MEKSDVVKLREELKERIDLSFLEFLRLTRDYSLPQIKQAVYEILGETPKDDKPKYVTWTPAGFRPAHRRMGDSGRSDSDTNGTSEANNGGFTPFPTETIQLPQKEEY